jgi:hypothetical protein
VRASSDAIRARTPDAGSAAPGGRDRARRSVGSATTRADADELDEGGSAHCRSSKSSATGPCSASARRRRATRRTAPLSARVGPSSSPRRWSIRGSTKSRSSSSVTNVASDVRTFSRADPGSSPSTIRRAYEPSPRAPSTRRPRRTRDSGRDATRRFLEPVHVLVELPAEPRLADAGDPVTDECALLLVRRRVEELLDEAKLAVAADERRLEACGSQCAAAPAATRRARQSCTARLSPSARASRRRRRRSRPRRTLGRFADEDRPGSAPTGCARRCSRGRRRPCPGPRRRA